jgi:hypothetical protein
MRLLVLLSWERAMATRYKDRINALEQINKDNGFVDNGIENHLSIDINGEGACIVFNEAIYHDEEKRVTFNKSYLSNRYKSVKDLYIMLVAFDSGIRFRKYYNPVTASLECDMVWKF